MQLRAHRLAFGDKKSDGGIVGMPTAEALAREEIDRLLDAAGWSVQDVKQANIHAARGVTIRASRNVFAFHHPGTLAEWLTAVPQSTVLTPGDHAIALHRREVQSLVSQLD